MYNDTEGYYDYLATNVCETDRNALVHSLIDSIENQMLYMFEVSLFLVMNMWKVFTCTVDLGMTSIL